MPSRIYALFCSPFETTYVKESRYREACTEGMYALCRHPGVLWFGGFYLCAGALWKSTEGTVFAAAVVALNVLYVHFQDVYSFPRTFFQLSRVQEINPVSDSQQGKHFTLQKHLERSRENMSLSGKTEGTEIPGNLEPVLRISGPVCGRLYGDSAQADRGADTDVVRL